MAEGRGRTAGSAERMATGERGMQRAGRAVVSALHGAMRALRLYPLENRVVQSALEELERSAAAVLKREGGLSLQLVGETLFVNDLRLRSDLSTFATVAGVRAALREHGIGVVEAEPGAGLVDWAALVSVLNIEPRAEDPLAAVETALERRQARHISVGPEAERGGGAGSGDQREEARRTYVQSVAVARELMNGVRIGKTVGLRKVKRAVQSIVDQVLANETSIVGMTTLREYDEYTFTHCVNVCIFSVALGKKLGLEKQELYDLGLGGLLHDIGKLRLPSEVVNKAGALSDGEWRLMKEHPTEGLLTLFRMQGFADPPLRAMLMVYEHHMKVDLTGYPEVRRPRNPTLFPRVVAVADAFDAATSKRSYQSEPWPPDRALREMAENPSRGFDGLLVKAFINMTGIYPVGSVVILDTYEMAVVMAANPNPEAVHQPVVRIVYDALGVPRDDPPRVDLSETDPETGRPLRTIVKTTDPERYGIDVARYF